MSTEKQSKKDTWDPCFHRNFLGFANIAPFWESLGYKLKEWPNIDDYNLLAKACQLSLCFIEQKNEMRY
ncbi:MAG: hypothetical protein AB7V32_09175, partial [Candidatus Berkiella sp.]